MCWKPFCHARSVSHGTRTGSLTKEDSSLTRASTEMKLITAAIYTNFTTHIIDDEGIEQVDAYTAGPRSHRLILQFKRAE